MLKILFVNELWYPNGGGGEITLHEYIVKLSRIKAIKSIILTQKGAYRYENISNINIYEIPFRSCLARTFSLRKYIKRIISLTLIEFYLLFILSKDKEIKIVHVISPPLAFIILPLIKLLKRKVILSTRSFTGENWYLIEKSPIKASLIYNLEKLCLSAPYDVLVIINSTLKDAIVHKRIHVRAKKLIFNKNMQGAIDLERFLRKRRSKMQMNMNRRGVTLLYIGHLSKAKGFHTLLSAYRNICQKNNETRLLIVGEEVNKKETNFRGIPPKRIICIGKVHYQNMPMVYNVADILVLPSLTEGFPRSLLEAMAAGLAVIASNVGGIRDIIRHRYNGLLFKSGDARDLEKKLLELIKDEDLREKLGRNAMKTVLKRCRWENFIKEYLRIYINLLKDF
mgnify:CR=1 FL=1